MQEELLLWWPMLKYHLLCHLFQRFPAHLDLVHVKVGTRALHVLRQRRNNLQRQRSPLTFRAKAPRLVTQKSSTLFSPLAPRHILPKLAIGT